MKQEGDKFDKITTPKLNQSTSTFTLGGYP